MRHQQKDVRGDGGKHRLGAGSQPGGLYGCTRAACSDDGLAAAEARSHVRPRILTQPAGGGVTSDHSVCKKRNGWGSAFASKRTLGFLLASFRNAGQSSHYSSKGDQESNSAIAAHLGSFGQPRCTVLVEYLGSFVATRSAETECEADRAIIDVTDLCLREGYVACDFFNDGVVRFFRLQGAFDPECPDGGLSNDSPHHAQQNLMRERWQEGLPPTGNDENEARCSIR